MKKITEDEGAELKRKFKLTDKQYNFCVAYVFMTEFSAPKAVGLVYDYNPESTSYAGDTGREARILMGKQNIRDCIGNLVSERNNRLAVDKLYVTEKLKQFVEHADSDNVKVKCLELLGKHLDMFINKEEIRIEHDPAEILKRSFEKRTRENLSVYEEGDEENG